MTYYIVKYTHTDLKRWKEYQIQHIIYLKNQISEENLIMSGPIENDNKNVVEAMLIFSVENRDELQKIIELDPYWSKNLVADCEIYEWNPIFGQLGASAKEIEEYLENQK